MVQSEYCIQHRASGRSTHGVMRLRGIALFRNSRHCLIIELFIADVQKGRWTFSSIEFSYKKYNLNMSFDKERLLDQLGWRILSELQSEARLSMAELGRRVGLSPPAAAERVRKFEDAGIIAGYGAQVDLGLLGRPLLAFVRISALRDVRAKVAEVVRNTPEVLEVHRGTGSDCFILKIAVRDIAHLESVTDRFTKFGQLTTSIVLSTLLDRRIVEKLEECGR